MTVATMSGVQCAACRPLARSHRVRGPRLPILQVAARQRCCRSRRQLVARAAASGLPSDDPYKVLGLHSGADSEAIQRQYNKLKREKKGNDAAVSKIEAAHSSLMMRNLTARLQGGGQVANEIKYADKAQYLPWRPRLYKADKKLLMYAGIAQALMFAWLFSATDNQPIIVAAGIGAVANIYKLFQIFKPSSSGSEGQNSKGFKYVLRGAFLALLATLAGCLLFSTLPTLILQGLRGGPPEVFYKFERVLLGLGTIGFNFLMTAYFR